MLIVIAGFPAAFIGVLFTGAVVIETMFSLDGLGLLAFESTLRRDFPVMFGTLYVFTLVGLVLKLVSDLTYILVDPRIDFAKLEAGRLDFEITEFGLPDGLSSVVALVEQADELLEQGHVRPGEDGQPDDVRVLLDRRLDDLLGCLVETRVDDLHARVAKRPCDDLRAPVVTVQSGLGDHHPNTSARHIGRIPRCA